MYKLRASCFNALLCHNLLSGQSDRIAKRRLPVRQIVILLRRCVIRRRLDKSDRLGIETYFAFYSTAPLCHHRIFSEHRFDFADEKRFSGKLQYFSKAQLKQQFRKYPMMTPRCKKHIARLYANTI